MVRSLTISILAMNSITCADPGPVKSTGKRVGDPESVNVEAIKLLEAKDHIGFLKRFMDPISLADAVKGKSLAELADDEITYRADQLLAEFKTLRGVKPSIDLKEKKADFKKTDAKGKEVHLILKWIDGRWYIK